MIERVASHGTRIFGQIGYGGRQVSGDSVLRAVQAPSGVPWVLGGEQPRAMSLREIKAMVRSYGTAAARIRELGFEGVEIHGAHGYLVHEFLSPAANKRTDEYGGGFENRLRFLLEIIQSVRSEVGPDFPVGLRLSGDEFVDGGTSVEHQATVAHRVAELGTIDYISQTAGAYRSMERIVLPPAYGQGAHLDLSRQLKAGMGSVPLMAVGRIFEPEYADRMIGEGITDMVVMTRALLADADMPNKAKNGDLDRLRHCVGAMECWARTRKNFAISCAVSAEAGRESRFPLPKSDVPSTVAVVGAGPAGMEAAVRLADAGHRVVILEKSSETGGRLNLAKRAAGLEPWQRFITYQRNEVAHRSSISVELNTAATPDTLGQIGAAAIVVASGATPRRPEAIATTGALNVDAALANLDAVGSRVAIYAETQHLSALTLADTLAKAGRSVTLLTPHAQIGLALDPNSYNDIRRRLALAKVTIVPEVLLHGADDSRIVLSDLWPNWPAGSGEPNREVAFDTLVYDVGDTPDDALFLALDAAGLNVVRIGDCLTPRNVIGAVRDGSGVGAVLEQRLKRAAATS
jgi:2,4-dienoyl-CoA reductase-like NADH-dependent reductase (Old Yellow Enzyme family)/thioredoxin reductase